MYEGQLRHANIVRKASMSESIFDKHMEPCMLCDGRSFRTRFRLTKPVRQVVRCGRCGLLQVNPREHLFQTRDFEPPEDRKARREAAFVQTEQRVGHALKEMHDREEATKLIHFEKRLRAIRQFRNKGKLLDVGCGHGLFLKAIGGSFETYGVEPDHHASRAAKEKSGSKIICSTLKEAAFSDNYFDVVTIINTLEHVDSPKSVLNETNRILKPDGVAFIETPNAGHFIAKLLGKHWVQFLIPDHYAFFTKKTIEDLLHKTGFDIISVSPGNKTLSVKFILYQVSWYQRSFARFLMRLSEYLRIENKTITAPQLDEMIVVVRKMT
jgi:2-polyprenyl-3-methyl-5-hydroxy-6-metoxy-1,4-benzoquinol methylase